MTVIEQQAHTGRDAMAYKSINLTTSVSILAAAMSLCSSLPAYAQQTGQAADQAKSDAEKEGATDEQITVTGSRIVRSTFETPTPVTVLSVEDLEKSSPSTLAAALNNQPALVASGGPNATAGQRTAGRNTLNLRGIGTGRTLTLVNGHRFPGSQPGGAVDTNLIPQALVTRVEVVTGGASAAYGSDAVAGVVNFILDTRYKGVKLAASSGLSDHGDGFDYRLGATVGTSLLDDSLHLVASGEYYKSKGIDGDARAWRRQGANLIPNPAADGTAANPDLIVADAARTSNATFGGYIASITRGSPVSANALLGQQFLSGGVLAPFDRGTNGTATLQDGGDGVNTAVLQPITRPLERATIYVGLDYDAASNFRVFVNGGYGYSQSSNRATAFHSGRFGALITSDNPFLPQDVRTALGTRGSFRMNRYDSEYDMEVVATNHNKRIEAGFDYKFSGFTLIVSGSIGSNKETALNYNNFIQARYDQGIDAISVNGQIVCRNQANGCVPINPFGPGSYTPEMINWFTGTSVLETRVDQKIVQATVSGNAFDGIGAGPWGIAFGAEYRHDKVEVAVDEISENLGYFTNNFRAYEADRSVKEAFGEINAPLLKDQPGAELLELNGALRVTDYENAGTVTTWKLAANYSPVPGLRFRGSYSRDIRAPNQAEMFTRGRQTTSISYTDRDPNSPAFNQVVTGVLTSVQGNPNLVPERAKTLVFGVVLQPNAIPGLSLSLDRFDIKLNDAIGTLSGQDVIDQCYTANFEQACGQIVRDSGGRITQINNSNFNLDQLHLRGWDFEARYGADFGTGRLSFRAQVSMLEKLVEQDFQNNTIDRVGETTTPKWRALGSIGYDHGPFNVFVQGRYIGSNVLNVNWTDADSEYYKVPAAMYVDMQLGYDFGPFSMSLNVQNLLNRDPVFAPSQDQYYNPTNPNVYDQVGRYYRLSIRAEF